MRAALLATALGAAAAGCALGLALARSSAPHSAGALDPEVAQAAVRELVQSGEGGWDNFPDPAVGRVLQPFLHKRALGSIEIDTNRFGQRERDFELPKPPGLLRIVFLGDSFVYGNAVAAEQRLGAQLERELAARAGPGAPRVECLHFGMSGWNIQAECSYLRRWLGVLEPDLVVQLTIYNDLEDSADARGFGAMANFSSQFRARGDGLVSLRGARLLAPEAESLLNAGLDHESRERYARAAADLRALAEAVEAAGGRYLALFYWPQYLWKVRELLAPALREAQIGWLSSPLHKDARYRVSPADDHWNAAGHAQAARLVYALIRERALLPGLELGDWAEARAACEQWHVAGELESRAGPRPFLARRLAEISARLDTHDYRGNQAGQVYAGIDADGLVSPYASLVLANPAARRLVLRGRALERRELHGRARVFLDEFELADFSLAEPAAIELVLPVPEPLRARAALNVRVEGDDWCYAGADMRHTVCFALDEIALEP